eukprot:4531815-Alexandrium_andersonii.AAC.1
MVVYSDLLKVGQRLWGSSKCIAALQPVWSGLEPCVPRPAPSKGAAGGCRRRPRTTPKCFLARRRRFSGGGPGGR